MEWLRDHGGTEKVGMRSCILEVPGDCNLTLQTPLKA